MNMANVSDMMDRANRVALIEKQSGAVKQNLQSLRGDEDTPYPKGDPQPFKAPAWRNSKGWTCDAWLDSGMLLESFNWMCIVPSLGRWS